MYLFLLIKLVQFHFKYYFYTVLPVCLTRLYIVKFVPIITKLNIVTQMFPLFILARQFSRALIFFINIIFRSYIYIYIFTVPTIIYACYFSIIINSSTVPNFIYSYTLLPIIVPTLFPLLFIYTLFPQLFKLFLLFNLSYNYLHLHCSQYHLFLHSFYYYLYLHHFSYY